MDSDIKTAKRKIIIVVLVSIAVLFLFVWVQIPKREELVMTPSTHEQIIFLEVNNAKFDEDYEVDFALYDKECGYVQICVKVPRSEKEGLRGQNEDISIKVNNVEVEEYGQIFHTAKWKKYVIYLLDGIEEDSKITFEYKGNVVEMY